ncbi:MAG TPA: hypothetical protein VE687_04085 [Stellaceae bacterium]|nr:hypothetical protein [Stellaceae bacterium]
MTAEDLVRRIAAGCAYVDERGGVGLRREPTVAIVRQQGGTILLIPAGLLANFLQIKARTCQLRWIANGAPN